MRIGLSQRIDLGPYRSAGPIFEPDLVDTTTRETCASSSVDRRDRQRTKTSATLDWGSSEAAKVRAHSVVQAPDGKTHSRSAGPMPFGTSRIQISACAEDTNVPLCMVVYINQPCQELVLSVTNDENRCSPRGAARAWTHTCSEESCMLRHSRLVLHKQGPHPRRLDQAPGQLVRVKHLVRGKYHLVPFDSDGRHESACDGAVKSDAGSAGTLRTLAT
ncbi:hypothetical protein VTO73DRAFT_10567 [Trametes versicolor]